MRGVSPVRPAERICSDSLTCSRWREERASSSSTEGGSGGTCERGVGKRAWDETYYRGFRAL